MASFLLPIPYSFIHPHFIHLLYSITHVAKFFSKMAYHLASQQQVCEISNRPVSSLRPDTVRVFYFNHPVVGNGWGLRNLRFPNGVSFLVLIYHDVSSWVKFLLKSFVSLMSGFENHWYTCSSSHTWAPHNFARAASQEQKLLILMKFNVSLFFFCGSYFWFPIWHLPTPRSQTLSALF